MKKFLLALSFGLIACGSTQTHSLLLHPVGDANALAFIAVCTSLEQCRFQVQTDCHHLNTRVIGWERVSNDDIIMVYECR